MWLGLDFSLTSSDPFHVSRVLHGFPPTVWRGCPCPLRVLPGRPALVLSTKPARSCKYSIDFEWFPRSPRHSWLLQGRELCMPHPLWHRVTWGDSLPKQEGHCNSIYLCYIIQADSSQLNMLMLFPINIINILLYSRTDLFLCDRRNFRRRWGVVVHGSFQVLPTVWRGAKKSNPCDV